jgi:hypothetical protein
MPVHQTPSAASASVRLYKRIAFTFIGLTLVLLGVVLAATFSRAVVTITAKPVAIRAEVKVAVAASTTTAETVPGMVIATAVSGENTGSAAAGTGAVIKGKATGTVLLVNKRAAPQTLVATTRLLSPDNVLFRLKKSVIIPANGELKDVAVSADASGAAGEIGPTTFTIPGLPANLQKLVYAFSEKPMTGGMSNASAVSQSDIDKTVSDLKDQLVAKATADLAAQAAGRGFTGSAIFVNEDARSVSAKVGDTVGSFDVLLKLTVTGVYYNKEKLQNLGSAALLANVPADMELGANDVDTAEVTVQNADAAKGTATLDAVMTGQAVITPSSHVLDKSRIVGLDAGTIRAYFKSFDSVSDAQVVFSPFWVKHAPPANHITINIK